MPVNWNMGLMPDVAQNALVAFDKGRATAKAEKAQAAMAAYAQAPNDQSLNALAPYDAQFVVQQKQANQDRQLKLDDKQHAAVLESAKVIGEAAQWADTPEKWDRAVDYLATYYPQLAQYKGKFSPETRMSAIAAAGQLKNYYDQNQQFTLGPGAKRFDPTGKLIAEAPFAPRPVTVGEGQTVVEYDPSRGGGTGGGTAAAALQTNPGALKDGPFAQSQPGYSGNSGGFATFATPEQGIAAQENLLRGAYVAKGFNTIDKIVNRYAPQGPENSAASVNNYKAYIAQRAGIDVNQPISPADVPKVAAAMREFETGNRPSGGPRVIAQGAPKTKDAPAGYRWKPDGSMEPIPGGPADKGGNEAYSQSAMDAFNRAIESADRLLKHPGFSSAVGVKGLTGGLLGGWTVPGTDAADFKAELDALKAQVFLPMVQSMKGMGALSNAEGEKLTASIGALDPNMSESAFQSSLQRVIKDLQNYRDRSTQKPAAPASTGGWGKAKVVP